MHAIVNSVAHQLCTGSAATAILFEFQTPSPTRLAKARIVWPGFRPGMAGGGESVLNYEVI